MTSVIATDDVKRLTCDAYQQGRIDAIEALIEGITMYAATAQFSRADILATLQADLNYIRSTPPKPEEMMA